MDEPKVGDKCMVWWCGDRPADVIDVKPYRGKYKELFKWTITVRGITRTGATSESKMAAGESEWRDCKVKHEEGK